MKFLAVIPLLLTSVLAAPVEVALEERALTSTVSYDPKFDVASSSLNTVSCSDGTYGLVTKYPTFGNLPKFPYIGGAPTIPGWNSPNCGKCYQLTYNNGNGWVKSIYMIGIDAAPGGFNTSPTAMNALTNGQAVALGRVNVVYAEVAGSNCGLP